MHIGLTAEWLGTRAGGLETYSRHLIMALAEHVHEHTYSAYTTHPQELHACAQRHRRLTPRYLGASNRFVAMGLRLPIELLRRPPDLLHVTSIPPLYSPVASVMTVHDLGHRVFPEMYPLRIRLRLEQTISMGIARATHIIAVSEATRKDLLHHYKIDARKITVVPEGALGLANAPGDPQADEALRKRHGIDGGYFLYVGRLHVRKNLVRLIDAYAALPAGTRDAFKLVLAGRRLYGRDEIGERIAELGISEDVVMTGHVADEDLPALYRGARAFVYPSLFEGFGLPPLEAMSFGIPVITSNAHSLPEVVADAGITVDATDTGALRDAMQSIAGSDALHRTLAAKGLERSRQFTWERAARETAAVYRMAVKDQNR